MQTTFKRIIVYDLETGGLNCTYNSITEIAMVAIDTKNMEIIEEFSVMLKPRLDLSYRNEDPLKEAKMLFKNVAEKDEDTKVKTLVYKGKKITLRNVADLVEDIKQFHEELDEVYPDNILELVDIQDLEDSEHYRDIVQLYFNNTYNKQALDVTKISRELMEDEGVEYNEAFKLVSEVIKRHTVGNSKPVISGHNIGSLPRRIVLGKEKDPDGFDNPFMEIFFKNNKADWFNSINDLILDTLKMARLKWFELPSYSLGVCANEVGITLKEAHRALPDTITNAKFLIKLLKSLKGDGATKSKAKRRKFNFNF